MSFSRIILAPIRSSLLFSAIIPGLAIGTALLAADSKSLSDDECLEKFNFKTSTGYSWAYQLTIEKKKCQLSWVETKGGQYQRWQIDICKPTVEIQHYPNLSAKDPAAYASGSYHCPKSLFGADIDVDENVLDHFGKERERIMGLLKTAGKDQLVKELPYQFSCFEQLSKAYLERCKTFQLEESKK
jgi:hypothetical protein